MNGYRFYADINGTQSEQVAANGFYPDNLKRAFGRRTTIKQLKEAAESGKRCNVVALLLGDEHRCPDFTQDALVATFDYADSDTSLGSVSREYLAACRRIPEDLARKLHPRLFARLDANKE